MTVSTTPYFSWSGSGLDSSVPPFNSCSPNLVAIQDYCQRRWGVTSLGCHVPPPTSTKSHPFGAANDLLFHSRTNFDRGATLEVIDFLIANSVELGINTIHDYFDQQRMWKPGVGWVYNAPIGSPGGNWIHVETTPAMFLDGRSVEDKLPGSGQGEEAMTPEDKAYMDAKFAAIWNTTLPARYDQPAAPAEERLTAARSSAGTAATQSVSANVKLDKLPAQLAALAKQLTDLTTKVDNITLDGVDLAALAELIRAQVRAELDATRFTGDR